MMAEKKLVPPDGGWGWIIVIAYSLYNFVFIPIVQNFGLIFGEAFKVLGLPATDGTFILTFNSGFCMLMGLITGPLLRRYSYRKVSVLGAALIVIGIITTMFSTTFVHFLITYGIIASSGVGLGRISFSLALNCYFVKRRSRASGLAFTLTGLGSILMPQLIGLTMTLYGYKGTILIVGALAAHTFIAAFLLQPVKWHMKEVIEEIEEKNSYKLEKEEEPIKILIENDEQEYSTEDTRSIRYYNLKSQSLYDFDVLNIIKSNSTSSLPVWNALSSQRRFSTQSAKRKSLHIENSLKDQDETELVIRNGDQENSLINTVYDSNLTVTKKKNRFKKFMGSIVRFFDLTLLKDPIYLNIMLGMSLSIFAELNFSLLTPFIMSDKGLNTQQTAMFISVTSIVDLCVRFVSPFAGEYFNVSSRMMYTISLVLLIISRSALTLVFTYEGLLGVAATLGMGKGIITVYWLLVIPDYVPIGRLASASSLQMALNGVLNLVGGIFLGLIKDVTGSFVNCIYVLNAMTLLTVICWVLEMLYFKMKSSKAARETTVDK